MLYLIGGAPRTGKTILAQRIAAKQGFGWISTDLLIELLRVKGAEGIKTKWNATPEAVASSAEWFFPYLERFSWGISSQAENYVIEGVDMLPRQVVQLSEQYQVRSVFLGCSVMTLDRFDRFPGHSRGYAGLPDAVRRQFAKDTPRWSSFVQQEAIRFDLPYVDMVGDFSARLDEAEAVLIGDIV